MIDNSTSPRPCVCIAIAGTILAVGNYMNGGTKRGRADGFKINALLKLESTKLQKVMEDEEENIEETAVGMNTMLDLISHQCWKADEHIKDRLLSELSCLKQASKIDLKDVQAKVKKLSSDIVRLDGNYKRVVETTKDIDVSENRAMQTVLLLLLILEESIH